MSQNQKDGLTVDEVVASAHKGNYQLPIPESFVRSSLPFLDTDCREVVLWPIDKIENEMESRLLWVECLSIEEVCKLGLDKSARKEFLRGTEFLYEAEIWDFGEIHKLQAADGKLAFLLGIYNQTSALMSIGPDPPVTVGVYPNEDAMNTDLHERRIFMSGLDGDLPDDLLNACLDTAISRAKIQVE